MASARGSAGRVGRKIVFKYAVQSPFLKQFYPFPNSIGQTTGFGLLSSDVKAHYCWYTELLYCGPCMAKEPRSLPWRVLHDLDEEKLPVSAAAATFIDSMFDQVSYMDSKSLYLRLSNPCFVFRNLLCCVTPV